MTGIPPQQDPMLRLQYYKETGQSDLAQKYEQYLHETGQFKEPGPQDIHAQYRSGALQKRMAGANARDAANLADEEALPQGAREAFGGTLASLVGGVPGGKAFTAMARSALKGQKYGDAYSDVERAIGRTPAEVRYPMGLAGAALSTAVMPGASLPAKMGQYGVLEAVLSGDPEADITQRGNQGIVQGIEGYGLGKAGGLVSKIPGLKGVSKGVSNLAQRAANAMRVRGVGGMDVVPEQLGPTAPAPRPPSAPPPAKPGLNPRIRAGLNQMEVVEPTAAPQASRQPSTPPSWNEKLNTRLSQWAPETPVQPAVEPAPQAIPQAPIPEAPAEAPRSGRPKARRPLTVRMPTPPEPQPPVPPRTPIDDVVDRLTKALQDQYPEQAAGNVVGDAELAQFPHAQDDMEKMFNLEQVEALKKKSPTKGQARGPKPK